MAGFTKRKGHRTVQISGFVLALFLALAPAAALCQDLYSVPETSSGLSALPPAGVKVLKAGRSASGQTAASVTALGLAAGLGGGGSTSTSQSVRLLMNAASDDASTAHGHGE